MASEYRHDPNFDLFPESWSIDRIVLFASRAGAEPYLAKVFPLNCNCIIASADRYFPRHPLLQERVFEALAENSKLRVVLFNASAVRELKIVSDRLLVMDELISQDFKHHPAERLAHLNLTPERISFLVHQFFDQWDKLARQGNSEFGLRNYLEFRNLDWRADLLTSESKTDADLDDFSVMGPDLFLS
jgi:hypothetical protein